MEFVFLIGYLANKTNFDTVVSILSFSESLLCRLPHYMYLI
jgi:hypothetical protein